MELKTGNLFKPVSRSEQEFINELLSCKSESLRIEHIISQGHISPENFYYDQSENEFVAVLQGRAKLEFDNANILEFKPGKPLEYITVTAANRCRFAGSSSYLRFWPVFPGLHAVFPNTFF